LFFLKPPWAIGDHQTGSGTTSVCAEVSVEPETSEMIFCSSSESWPRR
jgi:hypothetical protein